MEIAQEYTALCSELDLQKKIKQSFKQHPFLWLSGAMGAGLLTTVFGKKRSTDRVAHADTNSSIASVPLSGTLAKAGWMAGTFELGKLLFPLMKPIILEFAQKAVQSSLAKKSKC